MDTEKNFANQKCKIIQRFDYCFVKYTLYPEELCFLIGKFFNGLKKKLKI